MATLDLKALARRGAEARLAELLGELGQIYAAFPGLRRSGGTGSHTEAPEARPRRGRKALSAAQRKAISERMRKYWAERRKGKSQKGPAQKG